MKFISTEFFQEADIHVKEKVFLAGKASVAVLSEVKQSKVQQSEIPDVYLEQPDFYVNSPLPRLLNRGRKLQLGILESIAQRISKHNRVYSTHYAINDWCRRNLKRNALVFGLFVGADSDVYVQIYRYRVTGRSFFESISRSPGELFDRVTLCTYQEKVLKRNTVINDILSWLKNSHGHDDDEIIVCGQTNFISGVEGNTALRDVALEPFERAVKVPLTLVVTENKKQYVFPVITALVMCSLFALAYQQQKYEFEQAKSYYLSEVEDISDVYHNRSVSIKLLQDRQYYLESLSDSNSVVKHAEHVKSLLSAIPVLQKRLSGVSPTLVDLLYSKTVESGSVSGQFDFKLTVSVIVANDTEKNAIVDAVVKSVSNSLGVDVRSSGSPKSSSVDGRKELFISLIGNIKG